jgi:hypothetical protein
MFGKTIFNLFRTQEKKGVLQMEYTFFKSVPCKFSYFNVLHVADTDPLRIAGAPTFLSSATV